MTNMCRGGQHKALATPGNSGHKGVHKDEPRPDPQPHRGIGWLVTQLSLRFPEQSKSQSRHHKNFNNKTTGQCYSHKQWLITV